VANSIKIKTRYSGLSFFGNIPQNWDIVPLKYCFDFEKGKESQIFTSEYCGNHIGKFPVYSGQTENEGVMAYVDKYIYDSLHRIFVTTVGAKAMTVKLISGKYSLSQNCALFIQKNKDVHVIFYFYFLQSQFEYEKEQLADVMQPSLRFEDLVKYKILLPNFSTQQKIADYLDIKTEQIKTFIENKKKLINLLEEQKKTIIYDAITKGLDKNVQTKPSGVEWLGDIPESWEVKKMKFLGEAIIGLTYSPKDIVSEGLGTLVLRSSNLKNNVITKNDNVYVNKEIPKKLLTKKGDILICSRNGSVKLVGKNAIITTEDENLTFGAFTTVFRTSDYKYIHKYFNSHLFKSQSGLFSTSTINQLTTGILNELLVPMPQKEERTIIVEFIESETKKIDQAISTSKQEIELIKEYKKSLIYHAVTGKMETLYTNE